MKRWVTFLIFSGMAMVAALSFGTLQAHAQEPKPPVREYPPLIEGRDDQNTLPEPTSDLQPDNHPLTGVQNPTLGTAEFRHSYWLPGFQYANLVRSSLVAQPGVTNWNSTNYLSGNLSVLAAGSHAQFSMNYSGGAGLCTDSTQGNDYFHQLGLVQAFDWRRWQLQFIDQFAYLPETQFGFGGVTNLSIPGVGGSMAPPATGLQNNYVPNQSIFSSVGPRYSNSVVAQAVYSVSPRGSITASGSYGFLRFVNSGNINSTDVIGNLGYNYALTKKDTLGILYRFTAYRYTGDPQRIGDHVANVAYGRKVTGRVALQLFGGPDLTTFKVPVGNATRRVSGSGGASLTYAMSRSSLGLTYSHGVSNGSGILVGSTMDQISADASQQLSRLWRGHASFGYAKNGTVAHNPTQNSTSFNSYFAGGDLDRPLGRNATLSLGYTAYIQSASQTVCAPGTCSLSTTQHQVSLAFTWHTRPYVLR